MLTAHRCRAANAAAALKRIATRGMATPAARIGDTKVNMSLLEKGAYINYQRIEDNLAVVRERCVIGSHTRVYSAYPYFLDCSGH